MSPAQHRAAAQRYLQLAEDALKNQRYEHAAALAALATAHYAAVNTGGPEGSVP